MQARSIKRIAETASVQKANLYLAAGWRLIGTHVEVNGADGDQSRVFTLGWDGPLEELERPMSEAEAELRARLAAKVKAN